MLELDLAQPPHVGQRPAERGEVVVGLDAEVAQAPPQRLADQRVQLAVGLEALALLLRRRRHVANPPLADDLLRPALLHRRHGAKRRWRDEACPGVRPRNTSPQHVSQVSDRGQSLGPGSSGECPGSARGSNWLEALRIDVDDRGQLRAAHRRRGGGEQPRRLRGDPARVRRLRDELRAVLAAQAQQRCRAEQLRALDRPPSAPRAPARPARSPARVTTMRTRWVYGG